MFNLITGNMWRNSVSWIRCTLKESNTMPMSFSCFWSAPSRPIFPMEYLRIPLTRPSSGAWSKSAPAKSKTFLTLFFCYAFLIYFYISPSGVYSVKANCLYSQLQSVFPSERNLPHWKNVWMITPRKRKCPLSALIAELQICWSSKNSVHFQSQLIISYPFYIHID